MACDYRAVADLARDRALLLRPCLVVAAVPEVERRWAPCNFSQIASMERDFAHVQDVFNMGLEAEAKAMLYDWKLAIREWNAHHQQWWLRKDGRWFTAANSIDVRNICRAEVYLKDVIERALDMPLAAPSTGRLFLFHNRDIKEACVADGQRIAAEAETYYKSADTATALQRLRRVRLNYVYNQSYGCRLQFAQYEILVSWFPGHFRRPYTQFY